MTQQKRKRTEGEIYEREDSFISNSDDESDIDISSALTGKKPRKEAHTFHTASENEEEELEEIIRESMSKRDMKSGTEFLKKTKGKTKIAKGEVGGGSFQSMGAFPSSYFNTSIILFI